MVAVSEKRYKSFADWPEFWLFYLSQHMKVGTRAFHWVGTLIAFASLPVAIVDQFTDFLIGNNLRWLLIPAGILVTYILGFVSHWTIEKNQPATFVFPLLSVGGDLYMFGLMSMRRMDRHLAEVRRRLGSGWVVNRYGLWPPDEARARKLVSDRRVVPSAVA